MFPTPGEFGSRCMDNFAQVTQQNFTVYDGSFEQKIVISGLNIRGAQSLHGYLYTIADDIIEKYTVYDKEAGRGTVHKTQSSSGFYVSDVTRLFDGSVEKYRLISAIGGVCSMIDNSKFSNLLAVI